MTSHYCVYNSEIGDIAWSNQNNSEWGFCVFPKKRTTCFF